LFLGEHECRVRFFPERGGEPVDIDLSVLPVSRELREWLAVAVEGATGPSGSRRTTTSALDTLSILRRFTRYLDGLERPPTSPSQLRAVHLDGYILTGGVGHTLHRDLSALRSILRFAPEVPADFAARLATARTPKTEPPVRSYTGSELRRIAAKARSDLRAAAARIRTTTALLQFPTRDEAAEWIAYLERKATQGVDPKTATATLAEYGKANWDLAMRGLEPKTLDLYDAGWRLRIVPVVGHLPVTMITGGVADRAVAQWIANGYSKSLVKNALAAWVRVMNQSVRDEVIDRNPVKVSGWQKLYQQIEDELEDPRSLALPNWSALVTLTNELVQRSADHYQGWGDVVTFAACTAARIGEVSGCRVRDIDTTKWIWTVRRQTTPSPGGLEDKGTKGNRARYVPLIAEVRQLVSKRLDQVGRDNLDARLFRGPRGGRIATGVLRDATHWDEVVTSLGYEHLRRHDLRHTGLTWMADAGVSLHLLQMIAGHADSRTTEKYLHPDHRELAGAGDKLSEHLRSRSGPALRVV
jgi:integrase